MSYQLFTGLFTEGPTDIRFLESIVQKTLQKIAFECSGQIEIFLRPIEINKSNLNFKEQVLSASKQGTEEFGMMILCVHKDADNITDEHALINNILPAIEA